MSISSVAEKLIAGRWVAGPEIKDALLAAKRINSAGITAILNYLGEDFSDADSVEDSLVVYLQLISAIKRNKIKACISVKPSQLGLKINYSTALDNYSKITAKARKYGIFTWLDMEAHDAVDDTIRMYCHELRKGAVGICLQSYLLRSAKDAKELAAKGAVIRLVKGAYSEGSDIAYQNRASTTENYARIMRYLFRKSDKFMIATHDPKMMDMAFKLSSATGKKPMYAMLNGIRNSYAAQLAKHEHVFLYVPFGAAWLPYASRRLREEGHIQLILRSLFERQDLV
ncbi:MAG: proline dehydrogenase family protein [Candidatus Marsarchaeota archaeon]|jgi:proline dehydrogenase|nr:proline dehydrogenase family protein [Candidatus Marsarchaeota archaeon]